jgi:hypothetical protein
MIVVINRTVFVGPGGTQPASIAIPATTQGNSLIVAGLNFSTFAGNAPNLGVTPMTLAGSTENGSSAYYMTNILGGQTLVSWPTFPPRNAVIYELTPCAFDSAAGVNTGTPAVTEAGPTITPAGTNDAYFAAISQGSLAGATGQAYTAVSNPWVPDYAVSGLGTASTGMGAVALILNSTGAQTPTFTTVNAANDPDSAFGVAALAMADTGPSYPTYVIQPGSVASTYTAADPTQWNSQPVVQWQAGLHVSKGTIVVQEKTGPTLPGAGFHVALRDTILGSTPPAFFQSTDDLHFTLGPSE